MTQSRLQGVFNNRLEHLNKFRRVMADIQLKHNLISQDVTIIFNQKVSDIYEDTSVAEVSRITKTALVSKSLEMDYVLNEFSMLEELDEFQPWLVVLTLTDLPRHLNHDDQIIIHGEESDTVYTISRAAPINRLNDSIQKILIYNERNVKDSAYNEFNNTDDYDSGI